MKNQLTFFKILKGIVKLPVLPIVIMIPLYCIYKILKNTPRTELEIMADKGESYITPEMSKYCKDTIDKYRVVLNCTAIILWCVILNAVLR